MLLYYITDRHAFPGTEAEKRVRLLAKIAEAAQCGVDLIQLREKDLTGRELERLAREAAQVVRDHKPLNPHRVATRLLINSRTDIALAVGADGVHLTSSDVSPSDARAVAAALFSRHQPLARGPFLVAVSCHTVEEVRRAESEGADFAVFAPVFEKRSSGLGNGRDAGAGAAGTATLPFRRSREEGLRALKEACQITAAAKSAERVGEPVMPVLALGGITIENARECVAAGASGVAAIRLFQEKDIRGVVQQLGTRQMPVSGVPPPSR